MVVVFDGTFDGFLTAVFDVYALNIQLPIFTTQQSYSPSLFGDDILVDVDEQKVTRVRRQLEKLIGKGGLSQLWKVSLSEYDDAYQTIFEVIKNCLANKSNVLNDYGSPSVLRLNNILKQVGRERHRMKAFVRFEATTNNIWTSVIEPDFNVLPLIATHFKNRFADQQWLIYDKKRNYGIYYNLTTVVPIEMMKGDKTTLTTATIEWNESEKEFQNLWKIYFNSTNIESRKNNKLHLQHVPKRYWKYLSEKKPML